MFINIDSLNLTNALAKHSLTKTKDFCSNIYIYKEGNRISFLSFNKIIAIKTCLICDEFNSTFDCYLTRDKISLINTNEATTTIYTDTITYLQDVLLTDINYSYSFLDIFKSNNSKHLLSIDKQELLTKLPINYCRYFSLTADIKIRTDWLKNIVKRLTIDEISFYLQTDRFLLLTDANTVYRIQYKT